MKQNADINSYSYQLYSSISEVEKQEWYQVVDECYDLAMKKELIHLTEVSLSDQANCWPLIIRDYNKKPVACACLCLFQADGVQSSPPVIQRAVSALRKPWPNCLKFKVLFCGLPIPSAETHLRILPGVDERIILDLLNKIMQQLAKQEKAHLIVLKEFSEQQANQVHALKQFGFIRGDVAPTYELAGGFSHFEDYLAAVRANYRRQIQKTMKKFTQAKLHVQQVSVPEEIERLFTQEVYQLYLNVWGNSPEKLECLPLSFFTQLGYAMPQEARLTLITAENRPVAFAIGLLHDQVYKNLYCGFDYELNQQADLYFNLYYYELDYAFRDSVTKITLGQTSDQFKSRLGAEPKKRYFFVRAKNTLAQQGLKCFSQFIFPAVELPAKRQVFKETREF